MTDSSKVFDRAMALVVGALVVETQLSEFAIAIDLAKPVISGSYFVLRVEAQ